ncbi:hypothetical protein [Janibacter melonis]|uniref:hypothetical protein n=1 Tax=Janibacter melonis TaxID=262209 RepID=UPI00174CEF6A|nr:hypothetical protein [Janibacter melonis]
MTSPERTPAEAASDLDGPVGPQPGYDELPACTAAGWASLAMGATALTVLTPLSEDPVGLYVASAMLAVGYAYLPTVVSWLAGGGVDGLTDAPRVVGRAPDTRARAVLNGLIRAAFPAVLLLVALGALDWWRGSGSWAVLPGFLLGSAIAYRRAITGLRRREQLTGCRIFRRADAPLIGWTHAQAMSQYLLLEPPPPESGHS